jgi:hypothetical protein
VCWGAGLPHFCELKSQQIGRGTPLGFIKSGSKVSAFGPGAFCIWARCCLPSRCRNASTEIARNIFGFSIFVSEPADFLAKSGPGGWRPRPLHHLDHPHLPASPPQRPATAQYDGQCSRGPPPGSQTTSTRIGGSRFSTRYLSSHALSSADAKMRPAVTSKVGCLEDFTCRLWDLILVTIFILSLTLLLPSVQFMVLTG